MHAILPFRCLFRVLFYNCCINIMPPFFSYLYRYRYTRQTKAIQSPHLSSSLTVVPFLCCCSPCFWSSSYGRSRWLLIGGALWL